MLTLVDPFLLSGLSSHGCTMAHTDFGRSVNPISTRGNKLCPPNYYWHTRIFRPSDGPVSSAFLVRRMWTTPNEIIIQSMYWTFHMNFQFKISSMNLILAHQSEEETLSWYVMTSYIFYKNSSMTKVGYSVILGYVIRFSICLFQFLIEEGMSK